jgi:hypothetical protein
VNRKYREFIEKYFAILDRESQKPVDFKLNLVQAKYYELMQEQYPSFEGVREIVLKARQEGMSSFILALFAVDFLLVPHSVSICISHRKDSTDLLFKKVKFYIQSYINKIATEQKVTPESIAKTLLKSDNKNTLENGANGASFYIGTAGAKVGGRGGSARNILFSECAFYQDTELITAREMVMGTSQQVPQGRGMIFIESTANGEGNYYQDEWERASLPAERDGKRPSSYSPRFFGWSEFYDEAWIEEKRREFPDEKLFKQEYPNDPDEAFIASGSPYFNNLLLKEMLNRRAQIIQQGRLAPDGMFI